MINNWTEREEWLRSNGFAVPKCPGCVDYTFSAGTRGAHCLFHCQMHDEPVASLVWIDRCLPCLLRWRLLLLTLRVERLWRRRPRPQSWRCWVTGHVAVGGRGMTARAVSGQDFYFAICKRCDAGFAIWL